MGFSVLFTIIMSNPYDPEPSSFACVCCSTRIPDYRAALFGYAAKLCDRCDNRIGADGIARIAPELPHCHTTRMRVLCSHLTTRPARATSCGMPALTEGRCCGAQ